MASVGRRSLLAGAAALALWGCSTPAATVGPAAEYPRARGSGRTPVFAAVDSLEPTLRWAPFPDPADVAADPTGALGRATNVGYELRIWRAEDDYPVELVYARSGLASPWHALEEPLRPATRYLWTVRARFELDGEPRVSAWGMYAAGRDRRLVPSPYLYRLRTPER